MALVLAVDTSRSVDNKEYRLQMAGLANAFRHQAVQYAVSVGAPRGLAVTLVQWSGADEQFQVIPWTLMTTPEEVARFGDRIATVPRAAVGGRTALGEAMINGIDLIAQFGRAARRNVIDVSGDGGSNDGRLPREARERAREAGIQINAIAILNEEPRLDQYFRTDVIVGPGAFIITATDYIDFARAIRMKLVREILGTPIAWLDTFPMSEGADTGYWQVTTRTDLATLSEIDEALGDLPLSASVFRNTDGSWQVEAIVAERPEHWPVSGETTIEPLIEQDWVAQSQAALPAIRIGRFHIRGGWDTPPPVGIIDLVIEAGQAFGTGRHESTEGCLTLLQRTAQRRKIRHVLDVGTGAGILGIAAARLTQCRVIGTDNHARSVDVARENARLNDAAHRCRFVVADATQHRLVSDHGPYDLVFANILARPLMSMARGVAAQVAPGGDLILAGILNPQAAGVLTRYRQEGLQLAEIWRQNGWSSLRLHRPEVRQ